MREERVGGNDRLHGRCRRPRFGRNFGQAEESEQRLCLLRPPPHLEPLQGYVRVTAVREPELGNQPLGLLARQEQQQLSAGCRVEQHFLRAAQPQCDLPQSVWLSQLGTQAR